MAESKKSGYSCQPVTAKIKRTTQGGMKAEQPLIGEYAPLQMNSPAKGKIGALYNVGKKLVTQGAKKALPAVKKGGAEALKKGKNLLGKTKGATEYVPKKSLSQRAGRFIKNAVTGGIGYAAIDAIFGGDSNKPAETKPTVTPKPNNKKPYVKPGGKATGNMKDYKIGSAERYNEYEARGWKQDATTKGGEPRKKVKAVSTIKPKGVKTIKPKIETPKIISIETKASTSDPSAKDKDVAKKKTKADAGKKVNKTRSQRLRERGEKALADGNKKKALRLRRRYDKQLARDKKKKGQAAGAIEVSSPASKKKTKK